ncbi:hypothetical protein AB836_00720 [Rickettsiales bacterium (ex Bugula neritina AB1)]|nr:hypothetical protein AB836_00720 [Rickettsiales bacterium (ex Bugula neritina AB1)]
MKCDLTHKRSVVGCRISEIRKNISGVEKRVFNPNLKVKKFKTKELGNFSLRIATSTEKTIYKYSGIVNFLKMFPTKELSFLALQLRRRIIKHEKKMKKKS